MKLKIDTTEIERFRDDLKRSSDKALPIANRSALNQAAFDAQRNARTEIAQRFILRNRYTQQSVQVDKATGNDIATQQSIVGSVAPYMDTQESGGTKTKRGSVGVPIATSFSAGQGQSTRPRTRLPRKTNQLLAIRLRQGGIRATSKAQRNAIAVKIAVKRGDQFVFLELQRGEGIFRVQSGQRVRVKMLYDLSRDSVSIPRAPWLLPAVTQTTAKLPELYLQAMQYQIERHKLFKK